VADGLGLGIRVRVVQDTDGAVLSDPVADLARVDPDAQLVRKQCAQMFFGQAAAVSGPGDDWVHLVVNPQTPVPGTLEWLLREPVLLVVVVQQSLHSRTERVQLVWGQSTGVQAKQIGQEVCRGRNLHTHLATESPATMVRNFGGKVTGCSSAPSGTDFGPSNNGPDDNARFRQDNGHYKLIRRRWPRSGLNWLPRLIWSEAVVVMVVMMMMVASGEVRKKENDNTMSR